MPTGYQRTGDVVVFPPEIAGSGLHRLIAHRVRFKLDGGLAVPDHRVTFGGVIFAVGVNNFGSDTVTIKLLDDYDLDHFYGNLAGLATGATLLNPTCEDPVGTRLPIIAPANCELVITSADLDLEGHFTVYSRELTSNALLQ